MCFSAKHRHYTEITQELHNNPWKSTHRSCKWDLSDSLELSVAVC